MTALLPKNVPSEWVLAAWNGWAAGNQDGMHAEAMAHAIAAVAPLIVAAERERCARVAKEMPCPNFVYDWPDAIAAAIRGDAT